MLTQREMEVMELIIQGYSNPEISKLLCISNHTTKIHVSTVYSKLGVNNRVQAVVKYLKIKNHT